MSSWGGFEPIGEEAFRLLSQFYQYDRCDRLDSRVLDRKVYKTGLREKIVFTARQGSRVPGYFTIPTAGSPPYPCVLQVHGLGETKEARSELDVDQASLTSALLSAGFAILALDAPLHGERIFESGYEPILSYLGPNRYRELVLQWAIEHRQAIDYLEQRPEIDAARIGVVGYSLGGFMLFNLAGVDSRIKAAVACVTLPISRYYVERIGWDETVLAQMAPIAPQNFAPVITRIPVLMLNGKTDSWGLPEEVRALYESIGSPVKAQEWLDCGHVLPASHVQRVVEWFQFYLKEI